ncbi:MAG: HPr family phosphocarrier protein [Lachnospiraceae bacterium]|nr:HPr family phosphocarrier protein [Lachnospiraceae bacterium]
MSNRNIKIQLESGLEARLIALLVQEASKYDSIVHIVSDDKRVNAKSIMGMMTLSLRSGEEVEVIAEGEDEEAAVNGIEAFLSGK